MARYWPLVVTTPTVSVAYSANHIAPSGPTATPRESLPGSATPPDRAAPLGAMCSMPPGWVTQKLPSGPRAMPKALASGAIWVGAPGAAVLVRAARRPAVVT